jgi:hypothetical protein
LYPVIDTGHAEDQYESHQGSQPGDHIAYNEGTDLTPLHESKDGGKYSKDHTEQDLLAQPGTSQICNRTVSIERVSKVKEGSHKGQGNDRYQAN